MTILAFHNTGRYFSPGLNNYSPRRLEALINGLINRGYEFVSLVDYLNSSENNGRISITFDDGYDSFYEFARPILFEKKIPAALFLPFGYIGKKAGWDYAGGIRRTRHLSHEKVRKLSEAGIEIGSHGFSHIDLTALSDRMLKLELERSKKGLEDLTGKDVKYISYPFGRFNKNVEGTAAELGYERGFSLSFFRKSRFGFTIPRFAVYSTDTLYSVGKKTGGGFCNYLEKIKGAIMNEYSYGTIFLNKFRSADKPEYY